MNRIGGRLTYSNVVATLALFLVLAGGTAFAAKQMLPKNSVGTKQVKNNAITTAKIKDGAVTGAKIQASSLGTVPSATSAANASHAATADTATNATTATKAETATKATTATTAATAGDSNLLSGIPAAGFMSSSRFGYGAASTDPASRQPLFTIGGIEVTTVPSAGATFRVSVKNLTSERWEFGQSNSEAVSVVGAGGFGNFQDPKSRTMLISGVDVEDLSKSIVIQCGSDNGPNLLFCFGQVSPGA